MPTKKPSKENDQPEHPFDVASTASAPRNKRHKTENSVASISLAGGARVRRQIANQEEHHRTKTFREELKEFW